MFDDKIRIGNRVRKRGKERRAHQRSRDGRDRNAE
jgi:hypothetical protein